MLDAAAMRAALLQDRADMAGAQISPDLAWRRIGLLTHSYGQIEQLVVQLRGRSHPRDVTELVGKRIVVREASPQLAQLRDIQRSGVPGISWITAPSTSSDLLAQLESGRADYAIVDANEFAFTQHLYPDVNVAFALPDTRALQWVVRADGPDLLEAIDRFFAGAAESGELASIGREAQAESSRFDYDDAHRFRFDIATRLPQLQALFQQAAQMTGVDWRLIAAVGYQESKWEMEALSGNGARGIMMLTTEAADTVGVKNRDALSENILGGARYLAHVLATIPKHVPEPDRTWLALAAYNVGYGHLEDARVLTQKLGKNPDSWEDVRTQLPLLADAQWYLRPQARLRPRLGAGAVRAAGAPLPIRARMVGCEPDVDAAIAAGDSLRARCPGRASHTTTERATLASRSQARRCSKNSRSSSPHCSASTPPNTST